MSQTSYSLDPAAYIEGELLDNSDADITSYVAGETIYPGRLCIVTSGKIYHPSQASITHTTNLAGVALRCDVKEQAVGGGATWAAGSVVPVLKKGRVAVSFNGGSEGQGSNMSVKHASDDTASNLQHCGKFTFSATSTTGGAEVTALEVAYCFKTISTTGVAAAVIDVEKHNLKAS